MTSTSLPVHIFADTNSQREFQCAICRHVLQQCYSTQCGHLFCSRCIMNLLSPPYSSGSDDNYDTSSISSLEHDAGSSRVSPPAHASHAPRRSHHKKMMQRNSHSSHVHMRPPPQYTAACPVCRQRLQIGDIYPCPYVDNKIAQQIVRCVHSAKGCIWSGSVAELVRTSGHLKQCGYGLYTCKLCKKKVVRNAMVRHQNEECKAQFMACPYAHYGCQFECRMREMERHCQLHEFAHLKLKLEFLEHQFAIPEIVCLRGLSHSTHSEANGRYYLTQKQRVKRKSSKSAAAAVVYQKNGGYALEFDDTQCVWQLRSLGFGVNRIIAYAIPNAAAASAAAVAAGVGDASLPKQLTQFMGANCVWNVYAKPGDAQSLRVDDDVRIEAVQLTQQVMQKWNGAHGRDGDGDGADAYETDTEAINGEFEQQDEAAMAVAEYEGEGVVQPPVHQQQQLSVPSVYGLIFGDDGVQEMKNYNVTRTLFGGIGAIALTGVTAYYFWSKFGKSQYPVPSINVLSQTKATGRMLLLPSFR